MFSSYCLETARQNCLENFPGKKSNSIVSIFTRNAEQSTRLREPERFRFLIPRKLNLSRTLSRSSFNIDDTQDFSR